MATPRTPSTILGQGWAFPVGIEAGQTATAAYDEDVRQAVLIIVGTNPGERVMRPDFGAGLLALVFEPNSDALAATTQLLVQSSLQQHLSHLIALQGVTVEHDDGVLTVNVVYRLLADGSAQQATFTAPGA